MLCKVKFNINELFIQCNKDSSFEQITGGVKMLLTLGFCFQFVSFEACYCPQLNGLY